MDAATSIDIASSFNSIPTVSISGAKLFQAPFTPSSRKVRMFLAEKNLSLEMQDVTEGFGLSKSYIARYAHAMVPMLELDDGTQIGEAISICRYIEELHPNPPLFGNAARDRAVVDMWERRAYLEGMGAVEEIFRNSYPLMVDRGLQGTSEAIPQIPALVERGRGRLRRFFAKFEERLTGSQFVGGEFFSIADITALCAIDFAQFLELAIPDDCQSMQRWHAEVSARPSAAA